MKEIREVKMVEEVSVRFVADDGKEFTGENAERKCRDYERTCNREKVETAYKRLDAKDICFSLLNWLGEYGLTRVVLNSKTDFVAMMDYFNVVRNVYDNTIEEPKEYPYTMIVASGCDWVTEYGENIKEELQKALEQLD